MSKEAQTVGRRVVDEWEQRTWPTGGSPLTMHARSALVRRIDEAVAAAVEAALEAGLRCPECDHHVTPDAAIRARKAGA